MSRHPLGGSALQKVIMKRPITKILIYGTLAVVVLFLGFVALVLFTSGKQTMHPAPLYTLTDQTKAHLVSYLDSHAVSPSDYVVSQFHDADVIFLGEYHRISQDALFIQSLIPKLSTNGIHRLGFEFSCPEDQNRIDSLVFSKTYDERLAIDILRNMGGFWPYREYLDIFKAVWSVNSALPQDSVKFRILGLTPWVDWEKVNFGTSEESAKEKQKPASSDSVMAVIINREAFETGNKILVYCGMHHAFTGFQHPMFASGKRAGQRVLAKHPGKVKTILLRAPSWDHAYKYMQLPFGGMVDQAFEAYGKPFGIDASPSPFGRLIDSTSMYAYCGDSLQPIALSSFCDGYVLLDHMSNYHTASMVDSWLDDVSFSHFKRRLPRPLPWWIFHPRLFMWVMKEDSQKFDNWFNAMGLQLNTVSKDSPGAAP